MGVGVVVVAALHGVELALVHFGRVAIECRVAEKHLSLDKVGPRRSRGIGRGGVDRAQGEMDRGSEWGRELRWVKLGRAWLLSASAPDSLVAHPAISRRDEGVSKKTRRAVRDELWPEVLAQEESLDGSVGIALHIDISVVRGYLWPRSWGTDEM